METTCVFCDIINGERSAKKIYEDEHTLAFLAKSNDVFGHTLVIPKQHVTHLMDCEQTLLNQTIQALKQVATYYVDSCGISGINVLNANGVAAEQSVPHLHFHIIPRMKNDTFSAWPNFTAHNHSLDDAYEKLSMMKESGS